MQIIDRIKQYIVKKTPEAERATPSCLERLENMKRNGFEPGCIIDCGASVGYWSWEVGKLFPDSKILAIEPNPKITTKTKELLARRKSPTLLEECAVGAKPGEAFLNIWDNDETSMGGSSLKSHVQGEPRNQVAVPVKTLDAIASEHNLTPNLLKLDLQGYEVEALKGATSVLESCEVVIVEFGCLAAYIDRATPYDLMKILSERDYELYDVVDLIYRPYDGALTGGDFFFVKKYSPLKAYKGYQ